MRVCRTRVKRARQETVAKGSFRLVDFELSETIGQTSSSLFLGQTDIVYAWNVAAWTLCGTRGSDCAAGPSSVKRAYGSYMLTLARDRLLENACESSDVAVVDSF